MSETRFLWTLTALPADPVFVPTEEAVASSLALFKELVPASGHVAERFDAPRFFDSEQFSYSARCPVCAAVVHRDKTPGTAGRRWFAEVDAIGAHRRAANTPVTLPGCGHTVSISAVEFEFPVGAARYALTAHFEVWEDEWFSEDAHLPPEPLEALSKSLGTPLLFVRTLLALLPTDRLTIEKLVSADDAARIAAASALDALPPGHFEDNRIAVGFIEDHADALLAAWHGTAHPLVRRWVLILLADAQYSSQGLRAVVEAELGSPGEALEMALYVCHRAPPDAMRPLVPLIRRYHAHADADVRWRCALALGNLQAYDPEDRSAIRALALDVHSHVRSAAVGAMRGWITEHGGFIDAGDQAVLTRVSERFPIGDSAHHVARQLRS
jgi:hypothetical protein